MMNKKNIIIISAAAVILVVALASFMVFSKKESKSDDTQSVQQPENGKIVPTVDSSVKVNLVAENDRKELKLSASSFPKGTKSMHYEITYETVDSQIQGVNGDVELDGKNDFERKVVVGTESAGVYRYFQIKDTVHVDVTFTGDYGEKAFSGDFDIAKNS